MTNGERMEAKLDHLIATSDWLVVAVKHLLVPEAGGDELEDWMDDEDEPSVIETVEADWVAPIHAKKAPQPPACPHNQQVLVDGYVRCARCTAVLNASGVRGKHATSPVPPAGQEDMFNHGSSKNPGSPLVPY